MHHIICFGNLLHGDDGFGHAVYQRLAMLPLPENWRAFDAGIPGLNALKLFQDCADAIIIDAIAPGDMPGRIYSIQPEMLGGEIELSAHGVGVAFMLQALASLPEKAPRIRIIAVEAASITPFQPGLSSSVANAVDEVVELLRLEFETNSDG
ncbi:MAG: hydrogenase maturation protease [Gammaproteobacteria bacterium]